jgi:glucosamine--fructose-6-phosphate aminotransferase (isomerizing)
MCGIVGYFGKRSAQEFLLEGLRRLEYRGYDSAGIALVEKGKLRVTRSVGKVSVLEDRLSGKVGTSMIGIAHTRWATHGKPSEKNAHPHTDCTKRVAVVHNGIIENYRELKETLEQQGHVFRSETDTEIIAHVLEEEMKTNTFEGAFAQDAEAPSRGLRYCGSFCGASRNVMLAARLSSPLVLGIGEWRNIPRI